jgi:PAS domain S-box-containing protein
VTAGKVISRGGPSLAADLSPDEAMAVLDSLMGNVPGAIYRVSLDDGLWLRLIGDEIERISGYPAAEFVDGTTRTLFSIVHPDDAQWVEVELRAAVRERRTVTLEYRIVRADGVVRWVLERGTTVVDEAGRAWLDGVIFDVTDRREAEERVRRQEADAARASELQASRTRIVEAADEARRRLERDLHDGAQQRFVSAAMMLQLARRRSGGDPALLERVTDELTAGLAELRELAHGLHPAVLTDHGLLAALQTLAARSPLPVTLEGELARRPHAAVESALYFTVNEALTNVAKYAQASDVTVIVEERDDHVAVEVRDDGRGGAELGAGSGLRGLADRLGALGGTLSLDSPRGGGTRLRAVAPRDPHAS